MDENKLYLESILRTSLSFDASIQKIVDDSKKIEDDILRAKIQDAVGNVMKHLTMGIIFPITERYPELDNEN